MVDHSGLSAEVRAEMLVGHLADLLAEARKLTAEIRLRSNASQSERSKIETTWQCIDVIREGVEQIRDELRAWTVSPDFVRTLPVAVPEPAETCRNVQGDEKT